MTSALFLLIALGGCASTQTPTPLDRNLPAPPSFAQPVGARPVQDNESLYVAYDRQKSGLERANSIISRYNRWYAGVRASYGAAQ